jgi:hypothetical protein
VKTVVEQVIWKIFKINIETENKFTKLAPFKTCKVCHGTGKKYYDSIFYYTCCLNKNKNLIK